MKIILRLLGYTKPYKHYLPEFFIYSLLALVFGLVNYTLLIPVLDILFKKVSVQDVPLPTFSLSVTYFKGLYFHYFYLIIRTHGTLYALMYTCLIIFCSVIISNFFRYLSIRVISRVKMNMLKKLRSAVYDKLLGQTLEFHRRHQKGELISILIGDVQDLENTIGNSIQNLIREPLTIIISLVILFYISPALTIFTLIFFPLSGTALALLMRRLKKQGHFNQSMLARMLTSAEETLGAIKIIKAFHAEKKVRADFEHINSAFTKTSRDMYNRRDMASPISEMLGILIMLVIVFYGGYLALQNDTGGITGAAFITYIMIYIQMLAPIKGLATTWGFLQKARAVGERIFGILDEPYINLETRGGVAKNNITKEIAIQNLYFKHAGATTWTLQDINLHIQQGTRVALVGKSGSGKSTLVDIILRLYPLQQGQILVDNIPLHEINSTDWYKMIGFVGQDPILFNHTILHNITFGDKNINMENVLRASKAAHAHEFIERLPQGYETRVGDRGDTLSGGQKQRITIARALYHNPPILILDEATAALDAESEQKVQAALDDIMRTRTTIVIAHRLSTITKADKIVVLNEGKIVETGTHAELMARADGHYQKLIALQHAG